MAEQFSMRTAYHLRNQDGEPLHLEDVIDRVTSFTIIEVYVSDMTVHIVMQLQVPATPIELARRVVESRNG